MENTNHISKNNTQHKSISKSNLILSLSLIILGFIGIIIGAVMLSKFSNIIALDVPTSEALNSLNTSMIILISLSSVAVLINVIYLSILGFIALSKAHKN